MTPNREPTRAMTGSALVVDDQPGVEPLFRQRSCAETDWLSPKLRRHIMAVKSDAMQRNT